MNNLEDKSRIPYNQEFDYRFIKPVLHLRNKTLVQFSEFLGVDAPTISRLENGILEFTPYSEAKFKEAMKRLRVSNVELISIRKILEMKRRDINNG